MRYMETSAKTGENVNYLFRSLIVDILSQRGMVIEDHLDRVVFER